jgi:hypothetical protein
MNCVAAERYSTVALQYHGTVHVEGAERESC